MNENNDFFFFLSNWNCRIIKSKSAWVWTQNYPRWLGSTEAVRGSTARTKLSKKNGQPKCHSGHLTKQTNNNSRNQLVPNVFFSKLSPQRASANATTMSSYANEGRRCLGTNTSQWPELSKNFNRCSVKVTSSTGWWTRGYVRSCKLRSRAFMLVGGSSRVICSWTCWRRAALCWGCSSRLLLGWSCSVARRTCWRREGAQRTRWTGPFNAGTKIWPRIRTGSFRQMPDGWSGSVALKAILPSDRWLHPCRHPPWSRVSDRLENIGRRA